MIPTIMITIILAITIIMRITCIILSLGIERGTLIDGTLRLTYSVVHTPLSVILLHHYHHHSAHTSICISFLILIISIFKILNIIIIEHRKAFKKYLTSRIILLFYLFYLGI